MTTTEAPTLARLAMRLRNRAGSYWWLAQQAPGRRTLTQEECVLWAREAEEIASVLEQYDCDPASRRDG